MRINTVRKVLVLSLLILAWFVGGPFNDVVRFFAIAAFVIFAIAVVFATIPARWVMGFLRTAVAALGIPICYGILQGDTRGPLGVYWTGAMLVLATGLVLGGAPSLPASYRRVVYLGLVALGWVYAGWILIRTGGPTFGQIMVFLGAVGVPSALLFRWWTFGGSPILEALESLNLDCRNHVAAIAGPSAPPVQSSSDHERRRQLIASVRRIGWVSTRKTRYRSIQRLCAKHRGTRLAWQIAYASAVAAERYDDAVALVLESKRFGVQFSLGDLALAFALRQKGDPIWRAVLARGRAHLEPGTSIEASNRNPNADPRLLWREDAQFQELERFLLLGRSGTSGLYVEESGSQTVPT